MTTDGMVAITSFVRSFILELVRISSTKSAFRGGLKRKGSKDMCVLVIQTSLQNLVHKTTRNRYAAVIGFSPT